MPCVSFNFINLLKPALETTKTPSLAFWSFKLKSKFAISSKLTVVEAIETAFIPLVFKIPLKGSLEAVLPIRATLSISRAIASATSSDKNCVKLIALSLINSSVHLMTVAVNDDGAVGRKQDNARVGIKIQDDRLRIAHM